MALVYHRYICFLAFIFSPFLFSQQIAEYQDIKERYRNDKLVGLKNSVQLEINVVDDELKISRSTSSSNLYLNENAKQFAKENVSYSSFIGLNSINASTQYLKDGKYVTVKIDEFLKKNELDGSFHDDVKTVNFIYPNMSSGSITHLETTEIIKNPRFLGSFYFGTYHPMVHSKLEIKVDNRIQLAFKKFNMDGLDIEFKEEKKKKYTLYTWESRDIEGIEIESNTPNYKNYYPHIHTVIEGFYNESDSFVKVSSDVAALYNWYTSMTGKLNKKSENQELVNLVFELTQGIDNEREKVRAIYYWVQKNIKYIAYEYALGGFIPRDAQLVYSRKFGDCKDNSNLLYQMLKIAGIESSLTWIGTRSIPYKYAELPTPAVDNHMILTYQNDKDSYYLDATGRFLPLEYPSPFIQGKEALVGLNPREFEIKKVPIVDPDKNRKSIITTIEIEDSSIKGHGIRTFQGFPKMDLFYALEDFDGTNEIDRFFKSTLEFGNNKFSFDNLKETHKYSYDKVYKIDFDFVIDDIVTRSSNDIMINLNLDKTILLQGISKDRKTDYENEYQQEVFFENTLKIPEGYTPDYIPENLSISSEYIDVSIAYSVNDDLITYKHKIQLKKILIEKEDFPEYNKVIKKIESAYKELTVLKLNT